MNGADRMLLSDMQENEICRIKKINDKNLSRRAAELGIARGQTVKCANIGLFSSPIAYEICSSKLAIRKADALKIEVEPI